MLASIGSKARASGVLVLLTFLAVSCAPAAPAPSPTMAASKQVSTEGAAKAQDASSAGQPSSKSAAALAEKLKITALELQPVPDPTTAYNRLAQEMGLFERHGLEPEIKAAGGGGPAKVQAVVAGEADVAVSDIIAAFSAVYEGADVRVIFVPSARYGGVIVADKKYQRVEDLRGVQWGVPSLGGSVRFYTILTLRHFGLDDGDVKWLAVGGTPEMLPALFAGRVAAATANPLALPLLRGPEAQNHHILVKNTADYTPPFPNHVIIARNAWLEQNPEAARRYVSMLLDYSRLVAKDQDAWVDAATKNYSEIAREDAAEIWQTATASGFWAENGGINLEGTNAVLDLYWAIRGDSPNDKLSTAADVFNTSPLRAVLDETGVLSDSKDQPDWYQR